MAKLNFKTYGSGDPIVIMHGLFGMLDNWQTIAKRLAKTHMVYIVDLRDHGKSEHTDAFNYRLLAEDIARFMEGEWIHQAHIIGHSMGGKTAIQLALDHPNLIDRLIVVDIGIKAYEGGHEVILEALLSVDIDQVSSRQEVEDQLSRYIADKSIRLFLMKNLTRDKEGGYRWKMNLPLLVRNYHNILGSVEVEDAIELPTMFIRGGRSSYIVDEDIPVLNDKFCDIQIETVHDAGHWVHAERPDELLSLVTSFLR